MKKFLLLTAFLLAGSAHADDICATRSSSACSTIHGFEAERKAGCGGHKSKCRKVFCSTECNPKACPTDPQKYTACYGYCTGVVFPGEAILQGDLAKCYGNKASLQRASEMKDLATKFKSQIKTYKEHVLKQEEAFAAYRKASEQVTTLNDEIILATKNIGDGTVGTDVLEATKLEIQLDKNTYRDELFNAPHFAQIDPTYGAPSKRSLRRAASTAKMQR